MIVLYLEAPFAVCRTFSAGAYRSSARFMSPTSVYGMILNIAAIDMRLPEESRHHDGRMPATLVRRGLPAMRLAMGVPETNGETPAVPLVQSMLQQLHNYPVGKDVGMPREFAKGRKNNIAPVRREFLSRINAVFCVSAAPNLETRIRQGLEGTLNADRYGLIFVGSNQFLPDRLEELESQPRTHWFVRVTETCHSRTAPMVTRLTDWIDRSDMTKTVSSLYAPSAEASTDVPDNAWITFAPE